MVNLPKRRSSSIRKFDWTNDQALSSDFQKATRDHVDWTASPLGQMPEWPASLRQMVLLCMADNTPSAVLWGPVDDTAIVYNEPFAYMIGHKHPKLQGQTFRNQLADHCAEFDATWEIVAGSGCTEIVRNQKIRQDRLGFVEEKTYNWKFVPIVGVDGSIAGSLVTVEDEDRLPPKRERSKSAVREIGNTLKGVIDRTAYQTATNTMRLHEHFSGKTCNCEKLWEATKQLEIHEARYQKFADFSPVGITALDKDYQVQWANKAYYDVMSQPQDSKSFFGYVHPEDVDMVQGYLDTGAFRNDSFNFECRLKRIAGRPAVSPSEVPRSVEPTPAWVLVSAYRENDIEQHTMAWIIDITAHKNAEEFLRGRMEEVVEERKEKERFIDQISHEIRNPLSAMMHCTDDIIDTMRSNPNEPSQDVLEAAQTIAYCTQHIKNIVGDVLTLSKLDSRLVEICPVATQPLQIVQDALKIFNGELRAGGIDLQFEVDSSLSELGIDWLLIDPGRMLQVLINIVTNAIKVVKDRPERKIRVTLSASESSPCENTQVVKCVVPRQRRKPLDFGEPANRARSVYLMTSVEDSGPGLENDELTSLFERFAQENPKTESKYGGSGLGLFISRDLTELQGGRIGVASKPGIGSTFVFSVEAKRTNPPPTAPRHPSIEIPTRLRNSVPTESPVMPKPIVEEMPKEEPLKGTGVPRIQQERSPTTRKVLVVEDNAINSKVLANQLRKRGFEVQCAVHGEEALQMLHMTHPPTPAPQSLLTPSSSESSMGSTNIIRRKPLPSTTIPSYVHDFDICLMDIEMPVLNGMSCAKHIRAFEAAAQQQGVGPMPIIAVTANARSEHGTAAIEAGMNAVTTKPYKIEELVKQMDELCRPVDVVV